MLIASAKPLLVKITDFGCSKQTIGTALRTNAGITNYLAPELMGLLQKRVRMSRYTNAVDLWSLGIVVYELLSGSRPFDETEDTWSDDQTSIMDFADIVPAMDMYLMHQFCQGLEDLPISRLIEAQVPSNAIDFIKSLLLPDPRARLSAAESMNHPWCSEQGNR